MSFAEDIERALGSAVTRTRPVSGGCIAEAVCATLADGRTVFAKRFGEGHLAGVFEVEAASLAALHAVGANLAPGDRIEAPAVLHAGPDLLVLEWLNLRSPSAAPGVAMDDAQWGRRLALFHRASSADRPARYGFDTHPPLGATPQDNRWLESWPEFWRDRRLCPMLDRLAAAGYDAVLVADGRRLADRLQNLLADSDPTPCLLHGDLWSGNRGTCQRESGPAPCWFDPAPFVGSREAEFGMTRLFGGFGPAFEAAYREAWPLPEGFDARADVYELHHHLNHLLLFGRSYLGGCQRLMRRLMHRLMRNRMDGPIP